MAFTALQTLTAAQLNDLDITTITTSGNGTIGGDLTVTGTLNATVSASGSDGQIQYNNGGAFGGASGLHYDDGNDRLGIGTTSPAVALHVDSGATDQFAAPQIYVAPTGHASSDRAAIQLDDIQLLTDIGGNGAEDFSIYSNTAGAHRLSIDSSGNVGIGTTSPTKHLHVYSATTDQVARFESGDARGGIEFADSGTTNSVKIGAVGNDFRVRTGSVDVLTVTDDGLVGVNTASPNASFEVARSSDGLNDAHFNGQVRIDGADPSRLTFGATNSANLWSIDNTSGTLRFFREDWSATGSGSSGSVKMQITDAGAVSITNGLTVGDEIRANGNISLRSGNNVHDSIYRVGGIYFTWDSDTYGTNAEHSIRSTDGDTWSDDITINSFGNVRVNIDSNNNGSNSFYIQSHGTGTGNVILYVPDTGAGIYLEQGWFRAPDDNGFYFENHGTGMRSPISEGGNYGSVATYGGEGGWEGWSIGGRVVFMHDMSNNWGIYNDVNNEWMIYGALNGDVNLYHNNSVKLVTQSDGTETTGIHTSRRSSTSSNWAHMQFEAATGSTSNSTAGIAGHLPGLMAGVFRVWYGNGEGWDSGNSGGTGYRFVGASSFVTRSSERWKKNIHSRTDDEIIPTAMNLLSCRTAVWDENSLDPVCCEDGEGFEEPEMCDDPNCDCECCTEIRNDPIQRRHFGRRGYIVEELEQVFPDAIFYERDGSPSGIDYSVITAELIDIVKLLVLQGDENNRRLSALEQL